jgi:hypothetical protein
VRHVAKRKKSQVTARALSYEEKVTLLLISAPSCKREIARVLARALSYEDVDDSHWLKIPNPASSFSLAENKYSKSA